MQIRISSIIDKIESKSLAGIITLGAPEGLCNVIAKIQDKSENGILPYPVFSLLPQDNVLGSEATSDFVLDYVQQTESLNEEQNKELNQYITQIGGFTDLPIGICPNTSIRIFNVYQRNSE